MRLLLVAVVTVIVLVVVLLIAEAAEESVEHDSVRVVAGWGREAPPYVVDEQMFTTTTTTRARTAPTIRTASVGAPAVAELGSSIRGFPCGGDLPPCSVLRRESMMAADPPRVWNGNCYMPAGSLGQCGRSTASGLWQVLRSTWRGFGGYVNAADAPADVQNAFARQLWDGGAGCSHWSAC